MNSIKLERKLLSCIITANVMQKLLADDRISDHLFSETINKNIYNFLMNFYNTANLIPNVDLFLSYIKNKFNNIDSKKIGYKNLFEKYKILVIKLYEDIVNEDEFSFIVDELFKSYRLRKVQKFVVSLYDIIDNGNIDGAYDLVDNFTMKQNEIVSQYEYSRLKEDFDNRISELNKITVELDYVPTKIFGYNPVNCFNNKKVDFDIFIQGGFYKGELIIFIGDPGTGKSLTLMEVAYGASLSGKNVFFATIEMSHKKQLMRLDSRISGVPFTKFRASLLTRNDFVRWVNKINNHRFDEQNGEIFVYGFPKGCTALEIEKKIKDVELKYKLKIDILVVDYLNDMKVVGNSSFVDDKDWKVQGNISWDLKSIAAQRNIPVVTATQMKPGASDGKIIIKDDKVIFKRLKSDTSAFSKLPSYHATLIIGILSSKFIDNGIGDMINYQIIKSRDGETSWGIVTFPNYKICKINTDLKMYRIAKEKSEKQKSVEYDNIEEEL